ncbi:hypothetical protein BKA59DRAFT_461865 [Fusarium tricinctum]|uniref:Uncharacterized protein n=1 Tax=Fusarium tricinctum TaxID=61284 RepID=A0A8K0S6U9_9HYPO|nr:hypothetical protein BKA59DRAFT_461865 [Fusarium tricinctum]
MSGLIYCPSYARLPFSRTVVAILLLLLSVHSISFSLIPRRKTTLNYSVNHILHSSLINKIRLRQIQYWLLSDYRRVSHRGTIRAYQGVLVH